MIKLSPESKDYIKEVFSEYTETDKLSKILSGRTIIHLYATEDTFDNSGELQGFKDALFFDAKIYMCSSMEFYTVKHRDGIEMSVPCQVRIFKDGSTMIIIDRPISIDIFQCLTIREAIDE